MWTLFFAMQLTGVSFWVLDHSDSIAPQPWGTWFLAFVTVAVLIAVLEITYTVLIGQTPGKDLLGVRVESRGGGTRTGDRAMSVQRSATRWLVPGVAIALPLPYAAVALGVIGAPAVFDAERRTLGDRIAGTRVVANNVAVESRAPVNVNVIRFAMEKWLGAVSGDHRVLKTSDPHHTDPAKLAD